MFAAILAAAWGGKAAQLSCNPDSFPKNLSGIECWNLTPVPSDAMGHPIGTVAECEAYCCGSMCSLYNFNLRPPVGPPCWILPFGEKVRFVRAPRCDE